MVSQSLPKIILGTHMIGDATKDPGTVRFDTKSEVEALLTSFHSRGYTHLDTARDYSPSDQGASEWRLGRSTAGTRFTLHSKVHSSTAGAHAASALHESITASLQSLGVSTVETMFLHFPDRTTPFADSARAMGEALAQGKMDKYGLSNYSAEQVERFLGACEEAGCEKPGVYEGHYNAVARGCERELLPLLRKNGMAFYAYSPAAGGLFSEHAETSRRWKDDNFIGKPYNVMYGKPPVHAAVATILELAEEHGIKGHAAAIRWTAFHSLLDAECGDGLIFSVSSVEQLHKTLDALEAGPLPVELAEAIAEVYSMVDGAEPPYHV
ncbi:hypothetical protein COCCADRAFT_38690 [Bipolaris zeicola 26-R-13]|uniref:NADP-dependent oxidoreductase domain-containing protein n=1 Tax=Cochliobolus carbonum (strain 26-R-13) TaxID=930089 RepID=W6XZP3_COCC2|nr:uncharacterized protein COCCADRAFT_38690 [Bipolaris zeicola 26-R-13]EUC31173.1 hypothetical protein COCCADRAFT_38690 [Bipolaris zeicola 26-R-13]